MKQKISAVYFRKKFIPQLSLKISVIPISH